jgi:hypothetical protein
MSLSPSTISGLSSGVYSPARDQDPVKVYQNPDFTGASASFSGVGDYVISAATTGIPDNSISSIRVDGPSGWRARLYRNSDFTGDQGWDYTYNQKNITNTLEDLVSAIRITRTLTPSPVRAPAPRAPAPRAPAPIVRVNSPSPEEGIPWWVWLIVAIIAFLLLFVGVIMLTRK